MRLSMEFNVMVIKVTLKINQNGLFQVNILSHKQEIKNKINVKFKLKNNYKERETIIKFEKATFINEGKT